MQQFLEAGADSCRMVGTPGLLLIATLTVLTWVILYYVARQGVAEIILLTPAVLFCAGFVVWALCLAGVPVGL